MKQNTTDRIRNVYFDPVCWRKVLPAQNHPTVLYRMRTYYFCSDSCRKEFLSDPEGYLDMESCLEKGGWRLCLKRVKSSLTGASPYHGDL